MIIIPQAGSTAINSEAVFQYDIMYNEDYCFSGKHWCVVVSPRAIKERKVKGCVVVGRYENVGLAIRALNRLLDALLEGKSQYRMLEEDDE